MTIYPFGFTIPLPQIDILFIHLGPLQVTGYGLMMMVAFLMAGWAIQVDLQRRGMAEEYAADIVFAAVVGGIVGAKIWYVLLTGEWEALLRRGGFLGLGGRRPTASICSTRSSGFPMSRPRSPRRSPMT